MSADPSQGVVLVTGATGTVGRHLTAALLARGERPRRALHAPDAVDDGSEACRFDFADPATWEAALDGVDRIFLMRPPAIADVKGVIRPFVERAARLPLRQVVVLSLMGVNPAMPHWQLERAVKTAGLPWVMLRPAYFMQNLETALRTEIRDHDRLRLAAGDGRTSFVDTTDIAGVAALALSEPASHRDTAYTLTGGEALSWGAVASTLSAELGRPIHYEPIGLRAARRALLAAGHPKAYVNVQGLIDVVTRAGLAAKVTGEVERLLGRPPRTLSEYVHANRDLWRPAAGT